MRQHQRTVVDLILRAVLGEAFGEAGLDGFETFSALALGVG